jgi:hypothetical protein
VDSAATAGNETVMSDTGQPAVPHPPYDELRTAAGDDPQVAGSVEALRAELHAETPNPAAVVQHANVLRSIPVLEARIANWWDDPDTQRWVKQITDSGL